MSEQNRIHRPGQPPETEQPVKIDMQHCAGLVMLEFNPPIVRMRLQPREARALAVAMLTHADMAEYPPEMPPEGVNPTPGT
jgi:hypothetical protein